MSARLGTLGDVDTNAWRTAGLVIPDFVPTGWTDIDFTDIFAGAGGSSIGLVSAGLNLKLAANHSRRAQRAHRCTPSKPGSAVPRWPSPTGYVGRLMPDEVIAVVRDREWTT